MAKTLIVIAGPTAIGKTSLAIKLANRFNTVIISADSRQFYREMEIGTAKPTSSELNSAKHYFVNSHSVTDNFNVGDYEKEAIILIDQLFETHDQVILAGGSGLFINAICNGFDELPAAAPETRNKLNQLFIEKGLSYIQERLKLVDPVYFSEVDIHNPQRIIRALEVFETSGRPFSELRKKIKNTRSFNIVKIGLNTDRNSLYQNINLRVDKMIAEGLLNEVERLREYRGLNALNTVGYSELFDYFDGNSTLEESVEKIKQNTRRFAKRQLTWFNKSADIKWFEPAQTDLIITYLNSCLLNPEHAEQKS